MFITKIFIHRLFVNVQKNHSNVTFTILDYGLDSVWHGRADITHFMQGNFFLCLLHSTSQGNYIFILFVAIHYMAILERRVCNKNYKNVAALNCVLKKAWDEITPDKLRDICADTLHQIEAVVQNSGR